MGIEPFLIFGIVIAMFVVQVIRAAHTALADRLEYSLLTMDGVGQHAARQAMAPEALPVPVESALVPATAAFAFPSPTARAWTRHSDGIVVRLVASRSPGPVRRAVRQATGIRQRHLGQHRKWFTPSILVIVTLPRSVAPGLRVGTRSSVVADVERVELHSPVLDQLLRVTTANRAATQALLGAPEVHEPLIEVMATHPLSVVTGRVVALWCTRAVHDPAPLVALAEELGRAMLDVAPPGDLD